MNCFYVINLTLSLSFFGLCKGQTSASEDQVGYANVVTFYFDQIGADAHLYTGKEYMPYRSGIMGTAFFQEPIVQPAELFYDGILYHDIPLLYDVVRGELVINRYQDNTRIKLINEKVSYFKVGGHTFKHLYFNENDSEIFEGFYDILYEGKATVFAARIKKIEMTLNPADPPKFTERDKYFVSNGSDYFVVKKSASVVAAFKDQKELIKNFMRKNKFRLKQNTENELLQIAAYYDSLIK